MGFFLIKGTFVPTIGEPDGDSVRFIADNIQNWDLLEGRGNDPGTRDSMQLRFEGIDALEKAAVQPFAGDAIRSMKTLIGVTGGVPEPRGYILAKRLRAMAGLSVLCLPARQSRRMVPMCFWMLPAFACR